MIKKNFIKIIIIIFGFLFVITCFYKINEKNYKKYLEIQQNIIKHPNFLPKKEIALKTSFGFKNLRADYYRLKTIQYIGGNVINSEYKKYLFVILDLITELNPSFKHPYIIGQLLLPNYNQRYENLSKKEQENYIDQGIKIGLKGIKNFCQKDKIDLIKKENNLEKLWSEKKYENPCKDFSMPYYLAYIYYFYKKDPNLASQYYKIAGVNKDSPKGAKIMTAIMKGKGGNREKSFFMFLSLANLNEKKDEVCLEFSKTLQNLGVEIFINKNIKINANLIKDVENLRNKVFGKFDKKSEEKLLGNMECSNYVNKALRELNLKYLENANEIFKKENNGTSAKNADELYKKGFIKFLPTDFQQYEKYGIIYEYNKEIKTFDYTMGNY